MVDKKLFEQAINNLDQRMGLNTKERLRDFYVPREEEVLSILETNIFSSKGPAKFLFTGHIGCGKTTELFKLLSELEEEYFTVYYSIGDILELTDIEFSDILVSMCIKLYEEAQDYGLKIDEDLIADIYNWFNETIEIIELVEDKRETSLAAQLKLFLLNLGSRIKIEASTREEVRRRLVRRIDELRQKIDLLIGGIQSKSGKKEIIVVIDDLDKPDLETIEKLFFGHSQTLTSPACKIIFTVPLSLVYTKRFKQLERYFERPISLPVTRISHKDGTKDVEAYNKLKEIIGKRADLQLFGQEVLDELIRISGGVLRDLSEDIRDCCIRCLSSSKEKIDLEIVNKVRSGRRNNFLRQIEEKDYERLREISEKKSSKRDAEFLELLHNMSVLEYMNDELWYDIHPVVKMLLEEEA